MSGAFYLSVGTAICTNNKLRHLKIILEHQRQSFSCVCLPVIELAKLLILASNINGIEKSLQVKHHLNNYYHQHHLVIKIGTISVSDINVTHITVVIDIITIITIKYSFCINRNNTNVNTKSSY